ncbi:MAG: hypothetical protein JSV25_07255 [Spirochaetota bacterium]|nr:MAG: hypothetical protein JSV25_07255 [Spirochaetota bacterium]
MKIIINENLKHYWVNHPYDSNPDYIAKVNFFYVSQDKKLIAGYLEAPEVWFEAETKGFNEINYIVDGEIEFVSEVDHLQQKQVIVSGLRMERK